MFNINIGFFQYIGGSTMVTRKYAFLEEAHNQLKALRFDWAHELNQNTSALLEFLRIDRNDDFRKTLARNIYSDLEHLAMAMRLTDCTDSMELLFEFIQDEQCPEEVCDVMKEMMAAQIVAHIGTWEPSRRRRLLEIAEKDLDPDEEASNGDVSLEDLLLERYVESWLSESSDK